VSGPRLALGTVQWGVVYGIANRLGRPSAEGVERMLARARQEGVSVLDTARAYGESEGVIGRLVGGDPFWRVVTKLAPEADSSEAVARSLKASREALGRESLDTVLLHRSGQRTAAGGAVWDLLRRERDARRIGQLGLSAEGPESAWAALEDDDIACLQVASSLLDQRLSRAGFFERARAKGREVFIRSVYLQGVAHLSGDRMPAHLSEVQGPLGMIHAWAQRHQVGPALAFLAFAAALPADWVLLGCESLGQLEANLGDWRQAHDRMTTVAALAASIPPLPDKVLNPALWPRRSEITEPTGA
jgi:aryl-alcohol dehydrogenase-like predicted oxidoreductase